MTATLQRDQAANLAKSHPDRALKKARRIKEPWFRAQALAWVARYSPGETVSLAREAARAAQQCDDAYQRAAVRAWEIAALAEVGSTAEATRALKAAVETSRSTGAASERCAMRSESVTVTRGRGHSFGRQVLLRPRFRGGIGLTVGRIVAVAGLDVGFLFRARL